MQIVAPAGSKSALHAAIDSGADAVYLGMPLFGARAKAQNFDNDEFKNAIEFAHLYGTKVFVTLNTLIKDRELDKALEMAEFAYNCGVDAAIVQDLRFIKLLKKELPKLPLHASTQMGIHNEYGAKALVDLGIKRAVLSRETLPEDIMRIKRTGLEVEFFVQGALCVCFSGNCYFSSLASSYSGNRGKCMQLCRKPYEFHGKKGYFLSAKDICLYNRLNELETLGVDAIKIEGRMRSDEYVSEAVRVYKSHMPEAEALKALKAVFNRGDYCSAYLDKDAPFKVIYPKAQSNIGTFIGKIDKVASGNRVFVRGFNAHPLDGFKILRNGVEIGGATVRDGVITSDAKCAVGDELRRTLKGELSAQKPPERKIDVGVSVDIKVGCPPVAMLRACGTTVNVAGNFVSQAAEKRAVSECDVIRAFEKVSDYPFSPNIEVTTDNASFLPISALNDFRRAAYAKLYETLVKNSVPQRTAQPPYGLSFNRFDGSGIMVMVSDGGAENIREISDLCDYIVLNPDDYSDFEIPSVNKPVLLNAPIAARGDDIKILERAFGRKEIYGIVSNNLYTLKMTDKPIILGTGHNIIGATDLPHIRSTETDSTSGGFVYVYGKAPLMTLCHCPYGKCIDCSGRDELTDADGRVFTMRRYKLAHCYWQLLNCVPHNLMIGSKVEYKNRFYDCTGLTTAEIKKILVGNFDSAAYTRGNINKGLK